MRINANEEAAQNENLIKGKTTVEEMTTELPITERNYETEGGRVKQLSTGVWVLFGTLPPAIRQSLTIDAFEGVKLDKNGQVRVDQQNNQIDAAARIMKYHEGLIAWGVELVGDIQEYIDANVTTNKWEKNLKRMGVDIDDEDDREYNFLRYIAFESAEDWTLLSEMLVADE